MGDPTGETSAAAPVKGRDGGKDANSYSIAWG